MAQTLRIGGVCLPFAGQVFSAKLSADFHRGVKHAIHLAFK